MRSRTMCPFAESSDRRCDRRLTLSTVAYAMTYCAGDYRQCPLYRQLINDASQAKHTQLAAG